MLANASTMPMPYSQYYPIVSTSFLYSLARDNAGVLEGISARPHILRGIAVMTLPLLPSRVLVSPR